MVGIIGPGQVGKTTLAKLLINKLDKEAFELKPLKLLALLMISLCLPCHGQETSIDHRAGLWLGTMQVSEQMSLQLGFEIMQDVGGFIAKMNVIEQKALGIPMDTCIFSEDSLYIEFKAAGITYKGAYSEKENRILGTYSQGGGSFSLNMVRVKELPMEFERPQTPVRPFPYDEEEVSFENTTAGITLAGTLTLPKEGKDLPAVITEWPLLLILQRMPMPALTTLKLILMWIPFALG